QADDGIRDLIVTGVQTCALPISLALGMALIAAGSAGLARWNGAAWQIVIGMVVTSVGVAWAFAAMSTLITEAVRAFETGIANGKIGRASCRERVESAGVAVAPRG